ncbi:heme-binding protein [Arthrobacter gandavensis]|uniref:SOUL family heme-binding protein n=1 Tax=Arthrobacter gandavensis TaxID=169960 RepID=UPI00188ECCE6|nr:heme-binding protein [Arthrobacter gandavensis]MBF4995198.1 heme-binding protein [Arthrobacter gandavensis]
MTAEQTYQLISSYPDFELRDYAGCVMARVNVSGPFEAAGNNAFRPLFRYISGTGQAMTAPVLLQPGQVPGTFDVSFVLPPGTRLDSAPVPEVPGVALLEVPQALQAASSYSGRWTQSSYETHATALEVAVRQAGFEPAGSPAFARYDPPYKPWFMRRNEVVLPVVHTNRA